MRLVELNEKVKNGVFTEEEKKQILTHLHPDDNGELTGTWGDDDMPINFRQRWSMDYDIKNGDLVEYISKYVTPWLGAENYDDLFKTYGYTMCGICEAYIWFTNKNINDTAREHGCKPLEEATELELWKIIGICMAYWEGEFEQWYVINEEKTDDLQKDIKKLIGYWVGSLEDKGVDPWKNEESIKLIEKYKYTKEDYEKFSQTLTGCENVTKLKNNISEISEDIDSDNSKNNRIIEVEDGDEYKIYVDTETKVQYASNKYFGDLTVLVDAVGKPLLYKD